MTESARALAKEQEAEIGKNESLVGKKSNYFLCVPNRPAAQLVSQRLGTSWWPTQPPWRMGHSLHQGVPCPRRAPMRVLVLDAPCPPEAISQQTQSPSLSRLRAHLSADSEPLHRNSFLGFMLCCPRLETLKTFANKGPHIFLLHWTLKTIQLVLGWLLSSQGHSQRMEPTPQAPGLLCKLLPTAPSGGLRAQAGSLPSSFPRRKALSPPPTLPLFSESLGLHRPPEEGPQPAGAGHHPTHLLPILGGRRGVGSAIGPLGHRSLQEVTQNFQKLQWNEKAKGKKGDSPTIGIK